MASPAETPSKPTRRRGFWIVCIVALIFVSVLWIAFGAMAVRAQLVPCVEVPWWTLIALIPMTLPWLFGLSWLRSTPEDTRMPAQLVTGIVICSFLGILFSIYAPGLAPSRGGMMQSWAIESLREIIRAENACASAYSRGYSASLAVLGPPSGNNQPGASAAGLIDKLIASGNKCGYIFTYAPGPLDASGRIGTYTVSASSNTYEFLRKFFTDQSGVIRATSENRPATPNDPAIQQ